MKKNDKRINFRKKLKQEEEKNNRHYRTLSSDTSQLKNSKSKKVYNKEEVNNIVNRLYNNYYKYKKKPYRDKDINNTEFSLNTDTNETQAKKANEQPNVNVNEMIERFKEDQKKRNKRIEQKREELINNEKKLYTYKPVLNKKSKKLESGNKESFLERQKKYEERAKQREERYKEDLKKKEEEKINKNSYIYRRNKNKKDDEKKTDYKTTIKNLYEWESTRKKKLERKLKEKKDKPDAQNTFRPKINKKSCSLAKNNKNRTKEPDVFERLAHEDKLLKEKKQLLVDLYTPSFKPNIIDRGKSKSKNKKSKLDDTWQKKSKKQKKDKKSKNSDDSDDEDKDSDEKKNSDEDSDEDSDDKDKEEENFDYKQDPKIFAGENVQNALRKQLLNKMKQ